MTKGTTSSFQVACLPNQLQIYKDKQKEKKVKRERWKNPLVKQYC